MNLFKKSFIFLGLVIVIGSLDASEAGKQSWWQSFKNWWQERQLNQPVRKRDIKKVIDISTSNSKGYLAKTKDNRLVTVRIPFNKNTGEQKQATQFIYSGDRYSRKSDPESYEALDTFRKLGKAYWEEKRKGQYPYQKQLAKGHYSAFSFE